MRVHIAEARGFVAASAERYDLIQVALLDSFSAASAGLYAPSGNCLYTIEALQDDLRRLHEGGLLAITRWVTLPPRDSLKVFGAAVAALQRSGVADPASRLALVRSWQTSTPLVKTGDFDAADIAEIKAFCAERSFDVAFHPGMSAEEANRYNVVERPDLFAPGCDTSSQTNGLRICSSAPSPSLKSASASKWSAIRFAALN